MEEKWTADLGIVGRKSASLSISFFIDLPLLPGAFAYLKHFLWEEREEN
jgi:hypothetical protein